MLLKFSEQKDLLKGLNPVFCMKKYAYILNAGQAYCTNFIKLNEIARIYKKETPIFLIEAWLNNLEMFLGFEKTKNSSQLAELAYLIYREIHFFNIAELTFLFIRIKSGYYGEFYGSINGPSLIRWAREYKLERGEYIVNIN